jgi:hypothetical protein
MGETKKKYNFQLPDEQVKVKFIKKKVGIAADVSDNHIISGGMLEGAYRKFPVPMLRSGGLKNVLTEDEKDYLEDRVYQGQSLSMYSKFWDDRYVSLEKLGITLNLADPDDYIKYKILLGWNQVIAPSLHTYTSAPSAAYQFYLERDGEENEIKGKSLSHTKSAWKHLSKIDENSEYLSAVVFLMTGKKVAGSASLDYLNTEVSKLVDKRAEAFNELIEDSNFEVKVTLASAEKAGIILKNKGTYETKDGLPLTQKGQPATIDNVIKFLNDPLNNEVKELILNRIDNIKE